MNVPRDKLNSVLLPDGRVLILGGIETLVDGGPAEIFDPEDPAAGFLVGPSMKYKRGYHSSAILLPDGSVIVGGDPNGGSTPNERYLPSYFFKNKTCRIECARHGKLRGYFQCRYAGPWNDRRSHTHATRSGHARIQSGPAVRRMRHHWNQRR